VLLPAVMYGWVDGKISGVVMLTCLPQAFIRMNHRNGLGERQNHVRNGCVNLRGY
jgi:hypothetical protein